MNTRVLLLLFAAFAMAAGSRGQTQTAQVAAGPSAPAPSPVPTAPAAGPVAASSSPVLASRPPASPAPPPLVPASAWKAAAATAAASPAAESAHSVDSADAPLAQSVSPSIAAMLAYGLPKFEPPKPVEKPKADDTLDARDIDKPKNEIHRLPKVVVRAPPPPIFRHRDLYTGEGLTQLSMDEHEGLKFSPFSSLNGPIADQMYQDQERLDNMADLADTAHTMANGGDTDESEMIQSASQNTYLRNESWTLNGPGPQR